MINLVSACIVEQQSMLLQATFIMLLAAQCSLSADLNLALESAQNTQSQFKRVTIKGVAKFKPGGSQLLLSLLVEGERGMMPGGTTKPTTGPPGSPSESATPTSGPTTGPSGSSTGSTKSSGTAPNQTAAKSVPTSGPSGSSAGGYKGNEMEKEALVLHNKFRAVHDSPAMVLDGQMCQEAAAYAQKLAANGQLKHSSKRERNRQGENLSFGCSSTKGQTATEAVTNWYNEVCSPGYNFNSPGYQSGTGHFTQVVWKDSIVLGIGKADSTKDGMKCSYYVARYKPQGNFNTGNDDYKKNVPQGSFQKSYCNTIKSSYKDQVNDQINDKKNPHFISQVVKRTNLNFIRRRRYLRQ